MIEFVIAGEEAEEIKCFETEMFKKYKEIVDLYVPLFYKSECTLKLELGWTNSLRKTWSAEGLPLINGYECCVYCIIEKNGKEVHIKSDDGEADYYVLEASWMISLVCRRFHKLRVSLFYESVNNVDNDLKHLLSQLKNIEEILE